MSKRRVVAVVVAGSVLVAAVLSWTTGLAGADSSSGSTFQVANTGGAKLNVHQAPTLSSQVVGKLSAGQSLTIACQTTGDMVNGTSDIWDQTSGGYVSDYYVNTPTVGQFDPSLPRCGSSAPASPPAPSPQQEVLAENLDGVNWADPRDNYVGGSIISPDGRLAPTGLSVNDPYPVVYAKAQAILKGFQQAGATTVRLPINPTTVNGPWWSDYRGAIDAATDLGMNVILSYWDSNNSGNIDSPADGNDKSTNLNDYPHFEQMWNTVTSAYRKNPRVFFEAMNEPDGYTPTQWDTLAEQWYAKYSSSVPADHMIISAANNRAHSCIGWMQNDLSLIGHDPQLAGTLLSVHFYNWCSGENRASLFSSLVAPYVDHGVVIDEFGTNVVTGGHSLPGLSDTIGPESPVSFGQAACPADPETAPFPGTNVGYLQMLTCELHDSGVGAVYWPGLRGPLAPGLNSDSYSVFNLSSNPLWWLTGNDPLTPQGNGSIIGWLQKAWT